MANCQTARSSHLHPHNKTKDWNKYRNIPAAHPFFLLHARTRTCIPATPSLQPALSLLSLLQEHGPSFSQDNIGQKRICFIHQRTSALQLLQWGWTAACAANSRHHTQPRHPGASSALSLLPVCLQMCLLLSQVQPPQSKHSNRRAAILELEKRSLLPLPCAVLVFTGHPHRCATPCHWLILFIAHTLSPVASLSSSCQRVTFLTLHPLPHRLPHTIHTTNHSGSRLGGMASPSCSPSKLRSGSKSHADRTTFPLSLAHFGRPGDDTVGFDKGSWLLLSLKSFSRSNIAHFLTVVGTLTAYYFEAIPLPSNSSHPTST